MRSLSLGAVLLLVGVVLLAPFAAPPARAATADWTFLIYMDADNNLEDVGIEDFLEMATVGSTSSVNIVVQFDRAAGVVGGYGDWTTTKRFLVQQGMTPDIGNEIMDLGEVNMADPASLVSFATWGIATYPARHYFLDLWDHGLGWQGVILDGGTYMTTAQLASALSQIRTFLGRNIDIVGNDACRMTLEIMYELQPYVDYFVGSEKDEPVAGWPYNTFLAPVVAAPLLTPIQVGTELTVAYVASYAVTSPLSVTLSLVSSAALPALVGTFAEFVGELNASVPLLQTQVLLARQSTEHYEKGGGIAGGDEYDLYHFAENVAARSGNPRLAAVATSLESAIASAVLANAAWDSPAPVNGVSARHAHGLAIWFPDAAGEPAYPNLALSRAAGWDAFLAVYRAGTPTPIPVGATVRSVDTSAPLDGLADVIRVDARPPMNGTIFVFFFEGSNILAARQVLAVANQTQTLNLTSSHPGLFNVTILYYVGAELFDLEAVNNLTIEARYRFQGTVKDIAGRPLAGATVTLQNLRTARAVSATTNASGGYTVDAIVPDFFLDGDTLVLAASYGGRTTSASFVASTRSPSQTANLVLDTSPPETLSAILFGLAAAGFALTAILAGIVLWQRKQIKVLRGRTP